MNKKEFAKYLKELGLTETLVQSDEVIRIFQEGIKAALLEGKSVKLTGFVNFEVVEVAEREYNNPKDLESEEKIVKPAHRDAKAKLSKTLRKELA